MVGLVKNLRNVLKEDVSLWLDFGNDEYNISRLTPYLEKYDNRTIEHIQIGIDNQIIVKIL